LEDRKPMIIGHRGAMGEAPENTLASFQMALLQEAQGIELDVHLTKNGDIAVCHDATIDRTTDGSGFIYEMTTTEMKSFDAGSWFSNSFQGQQIPLLGEVFDLVPDSIMINVEIKASYDGKMEATLLDFLRERERFGNVVISSFDHKCISRLKQQEPHVNAGLLYSANLIDHAAYAKLAGVDIFSLHPHHLMIDKADVDRAISAELAVFCFTVNHIEDMRNMIRCGVSGIITDFPARLAGLLKQM
jgi:glycerophosphoryl diester phosphodiesterase